MSSPPKNMHENLPLGASPPAAKNNETSFLTQEVDICDGEVKLVRTKQSNQIWQVRIWVRGEGRYFRKSLRTRDLEKAQEKAKSIYYKMMGQVEIGYCCKTIWRVLKRNNQTESTDAATHSCRVEFSDESMLRENSMDGVLQQNNPDSGRRLFAVRRSELYHWPEP